MSAYLDWHVGMKVVCIDGDFSLYTTNGEKNPVDGHVYTIREMFSPDVTGADVCITLVEIANPPIQYDDGYGECRFSAKRFRPVHVRKTSIAVFERLLNPSDADSFRELEAQEFDYSDAVPFQ